jgi:hypothetical protein
LKRQRFDEDDDEVTIVLDCGEHPTKFPRVFLKDNFAFFQKDLRGRIRGQQETIQVPFICRVLFDIALRWAEEGTITLTSARASTSPIEINNLIGLALAAKSLEVPALGEEAADCMRFSARIRRENITKHHIERAYGCFDQGHSVRKVIVHCLLPLYMNYCGTSAWVSLFIESRFFLTPERS